MWSGGGRKKESEVAQSCPARDPMVCSLPGSSIHVIFQARVLEWVAIAFSMGLPYVTSKGLSPRGFLGKAHILRRTIGKSLVQPRCTSRVSVVRDSLFYSSFLPFLRTGDSTECVFSRGSVRTGQVVG